MIIILKKGASKDDAEPILEEIRDKGLKPLYMPGEEKIVTGSEQPVRVEVPVEMPDGVSYEGVFGSERMIATSPARMGVAGSRGRAGMPSIALAEDAAAPPLKKRPQIAPLPAEPELQEESAALICRIEAARSSYQMGEPIEIMVVIENTTGRALKVPAALSVVDGTARFQITDTNWATLTHPTGAPALPETIEIQPGARVSLHLVVNGAGGYSIPKPGTYHLVFLGSEIGLANSNTLTLRIVDKPPA